MVAGKTGTSNDYRDSWFAGFSGMHLLVVWVGHDDNSPTGLTGTTGALAAWSKLMGSIDTCRSSPLMPEIVEDRWIDYYTGDETSPYCSGAALACRSPSARRCRRMRSVRRTRTRATGRWSSRGTSRPNPLRSPTQQGVIIPPPET